jgi:hypothetical protein
MKKYTVRSHTEVYYTDSFEDAKSVMESMAITYKYACIIDDNNKVLDYIEM